MQNYKNNFFLQNKTNIHKGSTSYEAGNEEYRGSWVND